MAKSLDWKYCECGCKSYELTVGNHHFTVYNDLKGTFYFAQGHTARLSGKPYKSMEEIDEIVRKQLRDDRKALDEALGE